MKDVTKEQRDWAINIKKNQTSFYNSLSVVNKITVSHIIKAGHYSKIMAERLTNVGEKWLEYRKINKHRSI